MPNSQTNCNPVKNVFNLQGQKQERILLLLGKLIENRLKIVAQTKLEVENYFINQDGTLVFYHQIVAGQIRVYSLLLETAQLNHLLWKKPRLIFDIGQKKDLWQFKKLKKTRRGFVATWNSKLLGKKSAVYPYYLIKKEVKLKQQALKLIKHQNNPMLSPQKENDWEAFCTFNPAAIYAADKVHLLYRAQGYDYVSKIGYASSSDGLTIDKRLDKPVYYPSQKFEGVSLPLGDPNNPFVSGGGCGGCEDPRATIIDDRVYLTYVAYDGWNPPRVALSSITLKDFLNHNFLWEKPVLISQPGIVDKSAVIFPEKIKSKKR